MTRLPIPASLIDSKPVTVAVQLPRAWMASYFVEWVATEFAEIMLANEGQRLIAHSEDVDQVLTIVFTRTAVEL